MSLLLVLRIVYFVKSIKCCEGVTHILVTFHYYTSSFVILVTQSTQHSSFLIGVSGLGCQSDEAAGVAVKGR